MASTPQMKPLGASTAADPLRDGALRYTAFTSDVGEAFKLYISRRLYLGSYAVVALYGAIDTADKGRRAYARTLAAQQQPQLSPSPQALSGLPAAAAAAVAACAACLPSPPLAHCYSAAASSASEQARVPLVVPVAAAVLDTALWHSVASLAIPCLMINRTVWAVQHLMAHPAAAARLHPRLARMLPPAAGLALIPLAVHHIDEGVTRFMDRHVRPHMPGLEHQASGTH